VYCKNVITFERFNYKRSENYYKQLQTILDQDKQFLFISKSGDDHF